MSSPFELRLAAWCRSLVTGAVIPLDDEASVVDNMGMNTGGSSDEDPVTDEYIEMDMELVPGMAAVILAGNAGYEGAMAGLFDKDRCMGVEESCCCCCGRWLRWFGKVGYKDGRWLPRVVEAPEVSKLARLSEG